MVSTKTRLVKYRSENGGALVFEVEEVAQPGTKLAAADKGTVQAAATLERALDEVEPMITSLCNKLQGMVSSPQQVNIELGLKFTAGFGVILAKAGAEGHCKISLTWTKR